MDAVVYAPSVVALDPVSPCENNSIFSLEISLFSLDIYLEISYIRA